VVPLAPDVARRGVINRANEQTQAKLRSTGGKGRGHGIEPKEVGTIGWLAGVLEICSHWEEGIIKRTRNTQESGAEKVDGPLGAGWSPPPAVALELHVTCQGNLESHRSVLFVMRTHGLLDKYVENGEHRRLVKTVER